jgi:small subunit ribosomal protein S5
MQVQWLLWLMAQEKPDSNSNTMDTEETKKEEVKISPQPQREFNKDFKKNPRKGPRREARVKQEFDTKLLEIRRVVRVVSGGRRFSFSASVVLGDRKGKVGVGVGKAADTPVAIEKALRDAKKNMIQVNLTKDSSIAHEVAAKYVSSVLTMRPAPGKGIIAGSAARAVLEMAGVTGVTAKFLSRSKNKINNARVAVKALSQLK